MGFFLTNPFPDKPADILRPFLGHPQLKGCRFLTPFFEGAGNAHDLIGRDVSWEAARGAGWGIGFAGVRAGLLDQADTVFSTSSSYYDFSNGEFTIYVSLYTTQTNQGALLGRSNEDAGARTIRLQWDTGPNVQFLVGDASGWWGGDNIVFPIGPSANTHTQLFAYFSNTAQKNIKGGFLYDRLNGWQRGTAGVITDGPRATPWAIWLGDAGAASGIGNGAIAWIDQLRIYDRALIEAECRNIAAEPWAPFERRFWFPEIEPGLVQLQIDDLRHVRPVDQVDVVEIITIVPIDIETLRHARRVDALELGVLFGLFLASLRHARPVDAIALDVSIDLTIDGLRHGRAVDIVDLQELVGIVLDVTDNRHGRPVDSLLLDVDQPIIVDSLRHGRPIDSADVQPLLGDQTGMGATSSEWTLNAGQALNNASSIDFDYHVLEGVFDGNQSVLGVDGARVTGPAGMRELTALTVGADVDGQRRTQGEIAEVRIYAGALSQADRDRIAQELITKWITG